MINQSTSRFNHNKTGFGAYKNVASLLAIGALLVVINACTENQPSGVVQSDGNGGISLDFSVPEMLRNSRAVDSTALSVDVTVNGRAVALEPGTDQWIGSLRVTRGENLQIVATWSEAYNGGVIELAQAGRDYTVPVNPDTEIVVQFVAGDYFTAFDDDQDGVSNLTERNLGTDPTVAETSADPIVNVPITFRGQLPDRLSGASDDIKDSLFAVVEMNRISVLLSYEGETWVGETTFPTDTELLVTFVVYASGSRDVPLAKWQNTRNIGSGITLEVFSGDYIYDEFNSDGDEVNNVQEILDGTNPLDKSDPAPDLCAPSVFNPGCRVDTDGDEIPDSIETEFADEDGDNIPDYRESTRVDDDGDGINAQLDPNENDVCVPFDNTAACLATIPPDGDGDGIADANDNCPIIANAGQEDSDGDGVGNQCDNCPITSNSDQNDADGDGTGDACEVVTPVEPVDPILPDGDGDGIADANDNCPIIANAGQEDGDGDGVGNQCDNCPITSNSDQNDADGDGTGDACEVVTPVEPVDPILPDGDGDGIADANDNCPIIANAGQEDGDGDGVGNQCDNCPVISNSDQNDADGDGTGDACEVVTIEEPIVPVAPDGDGDGIPDTDDNCPLIANADQDDEDDDGTGDLCEVEVVSSEPESEADSSLLMYEYYDGAWSQLPDFDSLTPTRTGTAATFTLPDSGGDIDYGLRFKGRINVATAGSYTFYTASNDGSKLYIDGSLVVDNDGTHFIREESGIINLSEGLRDITLEYFQLGGTEALEVYWAGNEFSKQIISDEVLFSP